MVEVMGDGSQRPRLIDYRNVGPGPRTTDFAALDASIRRADVQTILRQFNVSDEDDLDPDDFRTALLTCAARVRDERKVIGAWEGKAPRSLSNEQWSTTSLQLAELASTNFGDLRIEEYLAMAMPAAYRHIAFASAFWGACASPLGSRPSTKPSSGAKLTSARRADPRGADRGVPFAATARTSRAT